MKLFSTAKSEMIDAFAKELAEQIASKYPPEFDQELKRPITEKRLARILEDAFSMAKAFNEKHKLGVYKKARLGNSFRWELTQLGYSDAFIEVATEGIIVFLTRSSIGESEKRA